jgi:flagellar biosynthesis protein FliR
MERHLPKPVHQLLPILVLAGVALAAWAAWLGWDQEYAVHPDGSQTGPYGAWQVIGLVLTLLAPVYWAASRRHFAGAVLGTTAGLTVAAFYDWSDDASGLFNFGVVLVMLGSLGVTAAVSAVTHAVKRAGLSGPSAGATT